MRTTLGSAGRLAAVVVACVLVGSGCGNGGGSSTTSTSGAAGGLAAFSFPDDVAGGAGKPLPHSHLCMDAGTTYPFAKAPLLGSPVAGYLGVVFKARQGTGIVVSGDFGYSATSTPSMALLRTGADVTTISDDKVVPDPGSVNPWTAGTKVFAPERHYHLLLIPQPESSIATSSIAPNLRKIPNVMREPVGDGTWFYANRGYFAFNGYNNFGWGGPTKTHFPSIFQVDLKTGQIEPCDTEISDKGTGYSFWPESAATPQTCVGCPGSPWTLPYRYQDPDYYATGHGKSTLGPNTRFATPLPKGAKPITPAKALGAAAAVAPGDGTPTSTDKNQGIVFPPPATVKNQQGQTIPNEVLYYYRPSGTVPGMNVAENSDGCATDAGTALDPQSAALVRVPVAPTTFNVRSLTRSSVFQPPQIRLYTMGAYGRDLVRYRLGHDDNFYLGNQDIRLDSGHGATWLIYPHDATRSEVAKYAKVAEQNGWNLLLGNDPVVGPRGTTVSDVSVFRIRSAAKGYYGALYPNSNNPEGGAPCYADDPSYGTDYPLEKVPPKFRITPASMGRAAMLGVVCPPKDAQSTTGVQGCVSSLKQAFEAEGGSWSGSATG